jgi:citrate synthase
MAVGFQQGLRDVTAAVSAISSVDGEAGALRYRGYDAPELAERACYEEVVALLWDGELPGRAALERLRAELTAHREPPATVLQAMAGFPRRAHPLDVLRAATAMLAMHDPDARDNAPEATRRKSVRLVAQFPVLVAAWARLREGLAPLPPDPTLGHAEGFLFLLSGEPPAPEAVAAMDALLVLHAEHELNASTFAARLVTATMADLHSSVSAALSALKGPRHGGANEDVVAMLEKIGAPERAEAYIRARLEARAGMSRAERADPRHRIPGWGHAVYRVHDPRAAHLRAIGRRIAGLRGMEAFADTAEAVYRVMVAETDLPVNVDFFSAVVYRALGIPMDFCTSIFAVARIAGWCAHVMEQFANNRLMRPRAHYVGLAPRAFVPLEART